MAPHLTTVERFWTKVDFTDTCWLWLGAKYPCGYGEFALPGNNIRGAHRVAYEFCIGPIPKGLTLDHLCRIRHCVNPWHLDAVTLAENILRGRSPSAMHARQTHCIHGHPFDEANTYYYPSGGRGCRACRRIYHRQRRARSK